MPRRLRLSPGGLMYHVLNRSNDGSTLFHQPGDYRAFVSIMAQCSQRLPMRVLAYCLMPNHYHLVLWPHGDGELSDWMQHLGQRHAQRYHRAHGTYGHLWQGRFKSFPIQDDGHLLTVLRYVERNPVRAGLVACAANWPWSSCGQSRSGVRLALTLPPVELPEDWRQHVDRPVTASELQAIRTAAERGLPYGSRSWMATTAPRLGLDGAMRGRGRPAKRESG